MQEIVCHAVNLFFEARGESDLGKRWVMDVVKNRLKLEFKPKFKSICEIITAPNHFSWYTEHGPKMKGSWLTYVYKSYPQESQVMDVLLNLARNHYYFVEDDVTGGAQYYMTEELFMQIGAFKCTWVKASIGQHIFFIEDLNLCL